MTRLLILAVGVTAGVVIALSLVYRREPVARAPLYREDDDGVQPTDPYLAAAARRDAMIVAGERSWTDA